MLDILLADLQLLTGPASPISVIRTAASSASGLLRLLQQKPAVAMATAKRAVCVCRAIEISTAALSAAACMPAIAGEDTRPLWTQLRVDALMCLLEAASSEERCLALVEQTEGDGSVGVASSCLLVLAAAGGAGGAAAAVPSKGVDAGPGEGVDKSEGGSDGGAVRIAANTLRNLALPLANRLVIGALRLPIGAIEGTVATHDALHILLRHVGHRSPNTAALVAACLRVLVESCAPNALRFARAHADAPHLAFAPLVARHC